MADTDAMEDLLGPRFKKPLALLAIISGVVSLTVIATVTALRLGREMVQTEIKASIANEEFNVKVTQIARTAWATDASLAQGEHKMFDGRLDNAELAIKELQAQGSETSRKLDAILLELVYVKKAVDK